MKIVKAYETEPTRNQSYHAYTNMGRRVTVNFDTKAKWCPQDIPFYEGGERVMEWIDEYSESPSDLKAEITPSEFFLNTFNHDFLTAEEKETIITAIELYAKGANKLLKAENEKLMKLLEEQVKSGAKDRLEWLKEYHPDRINESWLQFKTEHSIK